LLQVDLGSKYPIDAVKLYPKFGMPGDHFASEASPSAFASSIRRPALRPRPLIADQTAADYPDPVDHIQYSLPLPKALTSASP